jgi:hypothetical protein
MRLRIGIRPRNQPRPGIQVAQVHGVVAVEIEHALALVGRADETRLELLIIPQIELPVVVIIALRDRQERLAKYRKRPPDRPSG